jgi:hypothetical protein
MRVMHHQQQALPLLNVFVSIFVCLLPGYLCQQQGIQVPNAAFGWYNF